MRLKWRARMAGIAVAMLPVVPGAVHFGESSPDGLASSEAKQEVLESASRKAESPEYEPAESEPAALATLGIAAPRGNIAGAGVVLDEAGPHAR